jgi:hypothetical protein
MISHIISKLGSNKRDKGDLVIRSCLGEIKLKSKRKAINTKISLIS